MLDKEKNNHPLDLSYLSEMSGDSPEFMIEMIDMFKQQTPVYVAELKDAVSKADWKNVSGIAHKIKPTFAYIGRMDAKDYMQKMEHDARELKDLKEFPVRMEELSSFADVLYRQLDDAKKKKKKRL